MQSAETQIHYAWQLMSLVVVAVVFVLGCGQEEQVEKKEPASTPNAAVDFEGPGNRVDATFQSVDPE